MTTQQDRRRVLHSSANSTPTGVKVHSSLNNTNKPIQARVDLSQFANSSSTTPVRPLPVRSPTSTNGGSTNSTPSGTAQRPRAHVTNLLNSPNVTPSSSPSPFAHSSYSARDARGSASQPSTSTSPSSTLRQPQSPKARVRSPERERERTTPRAAGGGGGPGSATQIKAKMTSPKVTSPKVEKQHSGFPSTVSYLPSTVSTRNIHSPSYNSSPSNSRSPTLSSSSTTAYTSSTSPSPLTSPILASHFPSSPYDSPSLSKSTFVGPHSSSALSASRRSPIAPSDAGLLPPFIARSSVSAGATPTSSNSSSTNSFHPQYANDRSISPLPLRSPPLSGATEQLYPPRPLRKNSKPSRPPSSASASTSTATRHTRSHSTASSSSLNSLFSDLSASTRPSHTRSMSVAPVFQSQTYQQPPIGSIWSPSLETAEGFREEEDDLPEMGVGEEAASRRESEEREKDAKVERKIADLEITNASLLSINKSLERLKLQQSHEIRDLRRKMRESRPLASIRPLPVREHSLSNDSNGASTSDDDEEAELTWEELLEEDITFSAVAGLLESLLKRGREAILWQPPTSVGVGRVLNEAEMMSSAENSYYLGLEEGDSGYLGV